MNNTKYLEGINPKLPGIYRINNLLDQKFYIGSTLHKEGINRRLIYHLWELRNNKHGNPYLQNAYNKYGEENFEFIGLMNTEKGENFDVEQYLLDILKPYKIENGYNIISNVNKKNYIKNKTDNNKKRKHTRKKRLFINPNNEIIEVDNIRDFCKIKNLNINSFYNVSKGSSNSYFGWRLYKGILTDKIIPLDRSYDFIYKNGDRFKGSNYLEFCKDRNLKVSGIRDLIKDKNKHIYGYVKYENYQNGYRAEIGKPFDIIDPNGKRHTGINREKFCKENNIEKSMIQQLEKRGVLKTYLGWRLTPEGLKI